MKKLTKRVQAGGLWFDVPLWVTHIHVSPGGNLVFSDNVLQYAEKGKLWFSDSAEYYQSDVLIDLEGIDWRECCWYVGDQEDGEAVERREGIARGVELSIDKVQSMFDDSYINGELKLLLLEIRSGEVE